MHDTHERTVFGFPPAVAACVLACGITFCFSGDMVVERQNQNGEVEPVTVSELKRNDTIRTLDHSDLTQKKWTKVTIAAEIHGKHSFLRFHLENSTNVFEVTNIHVLMEYVENEDGEIDFKLKHAQYFEIGQQFLFNGVPSSISKIEEFNAPVKYDINTEEGSLTVNGVFTTGVCELNVSQMTDLMEAKKSWYEFLFDYKKSHSFLKN